MLTQYLYGWVELSKHLVNTHYYWSQCNSQRYRLFNINAKSLVSSASCHMAPYKNIWSMLIMCSCCYDGCCESDTINMHIILFISTVSLRARCTATWLKEAKHKQMRKTYSTNSDCMIQILQTCQPPNSSLTHFPTPLMGCWRQWLHASQTMATTCSFRHVHKCIIHLCIW